MLYRYELYDSKTGEYAGCGFLTGLRYLYGTSTSDAHIRRLAKPFSRKLDMPILKDDAKGKQTTSLFTEAGNEKFFLDVLTIRKTYESIENETGLEMKCMEVPYEEVEKFVLYEDNYQVVVDAARVDEIRESYF